MTIPSATDETGASFLQNLYMDTPSNPPLIMSSNNNSRREVNGVDGHEEAANDATDPNLGESVTTFYYDGTIVSPVLTTPVPHNDDDGLLSRQERKDPPGSHDHERSPDSLEEELMATLRKMDRKLAAGDPSSSGRLLSKSPRTRGTLRSQSKSTPESGGNRSARHDHSRRSKNDSKCKPRKSKSTGDCTVQRLSTTSVVVATSSLPPSSGHSSLPATSMSTVSSTTARDDDPTAPMSLSSSSHRSYRPHSDEPQSILNSTMTVSSGEFDAILGLGIKPPFGNDDDEDDEDDVDGCDDDKDKEQPAKADGIVTVGTEPSADRFKETSIGASTSAIATDGSVIHKEEEEQSPPVNPLLMQKRIKQSRRGASRTASLRRTKSDGPRRSDGRHHVNSSISSHNTKDGPTMVGPNPRHNESTKTLWEIKILFQTEHPGSPIPNDDELKTRYKNSGEDTTNRSSMSTSSPSSSRLRRHMPSTSSYVVNVPQQEHGGIVTSDDITIAIGRKCPRPSSLHDLLDKNRWERQENLRGTSFRSLQSSSSTSHIHSGGDAHVVEAVDDRIAETNGKTVTCRRTIILKEGINSSSDEVVVTRNIYHNDNSCQSNIASTNNVPFPYMMTFSKFEGEREEDSQRQPTRPTRHSSPHYNVEPRTMGRHPFSDHDVRINSSNESSLEKMDDKESDHIKETINDGEDEDENVPDFAEDDDEPDEADPLIPHSSMTDLLPPPLSDVQTGNGDNNVEMNAYGDVNQSKNNVPEQHSASPRRLTMKKFRSLFKVASPKYNHLDSATESFILDDKDIEGVHKVIGNSDIPNGIEQNVALPPPLDDSVWRLEPDSGQTSLAVSPRRKKSSMQIGAKKSRLSSALRHLHQLLGEEMQENKQWGVLDDGPSSSTELQVGKQPDHPELGPILLDERKIVESVKPEKRKKRKESKVGEWVELDVSNRSGVSVKVNVPPRQRSNSQKHSTRHRSPSVRETGPRSRSVPRKEHKRSTSPTKKSRKSKTVTTDRPSNYEEAMKANKHASDTRRHRARLVSRSLSPVQSRRQKSETKATTTRLGPSREKSTGKRRTGGRNHSHSMCKAKDGRSKNHAASTLPTSRKGPISGPSDHFNTSIQPMEQSTHDEGDSLGVYVTQSLEDLLNKVKSKLKKRASSSLVAVPTPAGVDDQIITREHNVAVDNRNNNSSTKQETVQNSLRDAMQW